MNELQSARERIDDIDREMAALFERRMEAVRAVGLYKRANALPALDSGREEEVIRRGEQWLSKGEAAAYYGLFIRSVMDISKSYQRALLEGIRVAYSGVEGAFAQIASKRIFPQGKLVPTRDFASAYNAASSGDCDCCVLPIENSSAGDVGQVADLLFSGSLYVNGVYGLPIRQCLLGVEGAALESIKTVVSHPQALSQCAEYIARHGFTQIQATNTAVAAKQVAELGERSRAAIASGDTAELYGLKVIDHDINESSVNETRFAVLSRRMNESGGDQSIIFFTVRNEAGELARAIDIIGSHGFNMRGLRSRPMKDLAWRYYFFVELDGDVNSREGKTMLAELALCCDKLKVSGVFSEKSIG